MSHKRHDWYGHRQTHGNGDDWCQSDARFDNGTCRSCGTPLADERCVHCDHLSETCHHGVKCARWCSSQERSGIEV